MRSMTTAKFRLSVLVLLTIFSLNSTAVPTSALDLGAKAKYIISVTPTAKAAVEAAVVRPDGRLTPNITMSLMVML